MGLGLWWVVRHRPRPHLPPAIVVGLYVAVMAAWWGGLSWPVAIVAGFLAGELLVLVERV